MRTRPSISRIVHGKTHLAVTTQAEPLPNTDTVDARRARRAAQQRDDALAQAREAAAREEDARKDLEAAVQLAREATDRAEDARKGREAAELALKERVARESVQTPAPPATVEAEQVQKPSPPSAIPAHHVSCAGVAALTHVGASASAGSQPSVGLRLVRITCTTKSVAVTTYPERTAFATARERIRASRADTSTVAMATARFRARRRPRSRPMVLSERANGVIPYIVTMPDKHYHVWTFNSDYRTAYVHPVRFRAQASATTWCRRFHGGPGEGFIRLCDRPDSCGIDGDARGV